LSIVSNGNPRQSHKTSLAIWNHTMLPATWHRWTCSIWLGIQISWYSVYPPQRPT